MNCVSGLDTRYLLPCGRFYSLQMTAAIYDSDYNTYADWIPRPIKSLVHLFVIHPNTFNSPATDYCLPLLHVVPVLSSFNWYNLLTYSTVGTKSLQGVKWLGCGMDHPPTSSTEVKERVELVLSTPPLCLLHNKQLYALYFSRKYHSGDQIKKNEMGMM
jgi:hypothetical protein